MNKPAIVLSISLLMSTAAYAGKVQDKALIPNLKQHQIPQDEMTQENSIELLTNEEKKEKLESPEESEKTEKPSWGFFDSLWHMGKSTPDKVISALEQNKLNLENKEGKDYLWLAQAIIYCTNNPQLHTLHLIKICTILKNKNISLKPELNNVVSLFLKEQEQAKRKQLTQNLVSLIQQIKPVLAKIDDTLETDLEEVKELNSTKNLVENKFARKLDNETIYQQEKIIYLIDILCDLQII
jgi:hypothetical protein